MMSRICFNCKHHGDVCELFDELVDVTDSCPYWMVISDE